MPNLLDRDQIEAAVQYVDERWGELDRPLLPGEREEWAGALAYVFEGELRPVLERWSTSSRPSPAAVLDYIRTARERPVVVPKEPPAPDLGGEYTPVVVESIERAREAIQRRLDRNLVACSPDVG